MDGRRIHHKLSANNCQHVFFHQETSITREKIVMGNSENPKRWSESNDPELETLAMDDFELISVLGVGTYGVVKLAKHKPTNTNMALKVLSKEQIVRTRQVKHILRERAIHLQLQHPFVAKLYGTFQDEDCLYLVVEYLPGGELWNLIYTQSEYTDNGDFATAIATSGLKSHDSLKDRDELRPAIPVSSISIQAQTLKATNLSILRSQFGGLKEDYAIFYLGCILSAIEYLHDHTLLYRDLKLENLVLDREGYLKLLDFGFSKLDANSEEGSEQNQDARNVTLCGSTDYMAPEVLLRQSYDQRVDIWSFGIVMYELLLGKTPFYHANPREIGRRILTAEVEFPNEFEDEFPFACDLLTKLLVKNPDERLFNIQEIKTHAFFTRVFSNPDDWERLLRRELKTPFIPHLDGPFDTSFFQTIEVEEQIVDVEPYVEDGSNIFLDF